MQDQEDAPTDDEQKPADEPADKRRFSERFRRVRRRPGLDEISAQIDGTATYPPRRKKGHLRSRTWSGNTSAPTGDDAQSLLQSIQQLDLENAQRRTRSLKEQQALWEATKHKPRSIFIENRTQTPDL